MDFAAVPDARGAVFKCSATDTPTKLLMGIALVSLLHPSHQGTDNP